MSREGFEPLSGFARPATDAEMESRAKGFLAEVSRRRTIRSFSRRTVPRSVIESCVLAAASAPSGANQQPWHFVAIQDAATKQKIRIAAEKEEREFYAHRAPRAWLDAISPLGTDANKPFLEIAPWLIAIFAQTHVVAQQDASAKNYYVNESVGIATGILVTALHHCGLGTLTHTPSPMRFLNDILARPKNERPYLLLVVGFPAEDCVVPIISKKSPQEILTFVE